MRCAGIIWTPARHSRFAAGARARRRLYANLHHAEARLRRLLGEFRFAPIRDVFAPGAA